MGPQQMVEADGRGRPSAVGHVTTGICAEQDMGGSTLGPGGGSAEPRSESYGVGRGGA